MPRAASRPLPVTHVNAAEAVSTDEDFRALERTRLRALVARDFALAQALHSSEFHLITPRGSNYSRESYVHAVESGKIVYLKWEAAEILVRRFASVALLFWYVLRIFMGSRN